MGYLLKLREIFKPEQLLTDDYSLVKYASDASGYLSKPDVVVRPRGIDEVAKVIEVAYENGVAVTARGGGSGIRGGAVASRGGILISFELMNRIISVSKADLYVEVEPGITNLLLRSGIESEGLIFPVDPASESISTIGGNVGDEAIGLKSFKYGTMRDNLLGVEFVTPQGKVLNWGGRTVKNVVGYDLTRLLVGSQGILGLITKMILRLLPAPQSRRILVLGFNELASACDASTQIVESMISASAIEIMDEESVGIVKRQIEPDLPDGSILIVEIDGCKSVCQEEASKTMEIARKFGGSVLEDVESEVESKFWKARKSLFKSVIDSGKGILMLNIRVSPSRIWSLIRNLRKIAAGRGLSPVAFGHAGSGRIHCCFLLSEGEVKPECISEFSAESMREVIDCGGDLLEEIRISMGVKPLISQSMDASWEKIMRDVKAAVDPKSIFNPGKLINE